MDPGTVATRVNNNQIKSKFSNVVDRGVRGKGRVRARGRRIGFTGTRTALTHVPRE